MPLHIDGKPFTLSEEDLKTYSKKMIFRVGLQYIRVNRTDPEVPPVRVSNAHILTNYRHHTKKGGLRTPAGMLTFFDSYQWDDMLKKNVYEPAALQTSFQGYFESDDPEKNYFLDNHPSNEVVKANPDHPNFDRKKETSFSTYRKESKRDQLYDNMMLSAQLALKIFDKTQMNRETIHSVAQMVVRFAPDYKIAHKLFNLQDMDDKDIRTELVRLANLHPLEIKEIMANNKLDYQKAVNQFIELGFLKNMGTDWVIVEEGKAQQPIVKIPTGRDPNVVVVDWLKNNDTKGAKMRKLQDMVSDYEARVAAAK